MSLTDVFNKIKKGFRYLTDPDYKFIIDANAGKYDHLDDKEYVERLFKSKLHYPLDLNSPKTYSEKLQWLKLYDRKPEYTTMVDKYAAKKYVADIVGEEYIIPTLGVWDSFDDIDFDALPDKFVLKTTHDSGGVAICTDKSSFDRQRAKEKIEKSLKNDFYLRSREWPYKDVPHRIIAEKFIGDVEGRNLKDYKIYCFNGEPKALLVVSDRNDPTTCPKYDYFDIDFNPLPYTMKGGYYVKPHPHSTRPVVRPERFDEMLAIAKKLSKGLPHARIDLYNVDGKVYFGEVTFFPNGGFDYFIPNEWDKIIGDWLTLPSVNKM